MALYVIEKGKSVVVTKGKDSRMSLSSTILEKEKIFMDQDLIKMEDGQYHFRYHDINYYVAVADVRIVKIKL